MKMDTMLNTAIWWTGAVTLSALAIVGFAILIAEAAHITVMLVTAAISRMGWTVQNLADMRAWVKSGRPKWIKVGDRGWHMEMRPSVVWPPSTVPAAPEPAATGEG